jgi:ATP-dependent Clp protease protease subunit
MTKTDFEKFALSKGVGSNLLDGYLKNMYINPNIVEERQLNCTLIDVFSKLLMDKIIFLGTEINDDVANIIVAQLLWLEQQTDSDITLYINSGGGSVISGYSIIDVCNFIKNDITTVITGVAASMAAVISSNGAKGKRFALPHAKFMIHQPRMSFGNNTMVASDIIIEAEEINKTKEELYKTLSSNSNFSIEEIRSLSERDKWYNMQEAIQCGFVDEIIFSKKSKT